MTHDHSGFTITDEPGDRFGAAGQRINGAEMGALVGAAMDGCPRCQKTHLDVLQTDPLTITRLVELSGLAVSVQTGGLPASMLSPGGSGDLSDAYRSMLTAGVDTEDHTPMYAIAAGLTPEQLRRVADDALDLLVGALEMGG